jgi:hypothetical protein
MRVLETYKNEENNLKDFLVRIGDLINVEGPLLSLYIDGRNNNLYLFDWVDSETNINRWLIYRVKAKDLYEFMSSDISLRSLFSTAVNSIYYYTDIDNRKPFGEYSIFQIKNIPKEYLPEETIYFNKADSKNFERILAFINTSSNLVRSNNEFFSIVDNFGLVSSVNLEDEMNSLVGISKQLGTYEVNNKYSGEELVKHFKNLKTAGTLMIVSVSSFLHYSNSVYAHQTNRISSKEKLDFCTRER